MLDIKDREGCITKAEMRTHFEAAIRNNPVLLANTPLGTMTVNGAFSHYADQDTDTMWLGFALGMRASERAARALAAPTTDKGQP